MNRSPIKSVFALVVLAWTATLTAADIIERKSASSPVNGEVTSISRDEISVTSGVGKKVLTIQANDVVNVRWDKEPAKLNLLRGDERAGRLQKAIDGYTEILKGVASSEKNLRIDLTFLIARATAKLAAADASKLKEAIELMDDFVRSNSTSFRYYDAVDQLGHLYVVQKDFNKANATYALLSRAPWPEYKMIAQIAQARVDLAADKIDTALAAFDTVASAEAKEPAEQARRFEALIGKAICLQKKNQHDQAEKVLEEVLRDIPADATAVQAEAYLRQGDSLRSAGKNKPALLAYLHVDLLFANQSDFHAEALYRLSQLWTAVGHPDRAADASARLQERYPASEWTKQLTGSSRG